MSEKEENNEISIKISNEELESIEDSKEESIEDTKEESIEDTKEESIEDTKDLVEELKEQFSQEQQKVVDLEDKLKHTLADYQNLERKTKLNIENSVNTKIDQLMLDFLQIYDDFIRAKEVFSKNKINTEGLESIIKNMESLLTKYHVLPITALGEIFDPILHEAISIIEDHTLDDDTITKEIRKGYISHNRVIRPALVEISKKSKLE